jgi:hypothetical protein
MAYKKIPANLYAYGVIIRYRNFILIKPNGDVKQTIWLGHAIGSKQTRHSCSLLQQLALRWCLA